jgi:ParB-like chromosome segregation protein Spo0J
MSEQSNLKYFKISDMKRAEYNPRKITDDQMLKLKQSIREFGFVENVVVNINKHRYGTLIGGHQRLTAVEELIAQGTLPKGIEKAEDGGYLVPAVLLDLTEEKEKILNLGLNKISGSWDEDKLFDVISSIHESPIVSLSGFSEVDVAGILDMGQNQGSKAIEKTGIQCERCSELKMQVMGHAKRTGHPVRFEENTDK